MTTVTAGSVSTFYLPVDGSSITVSPAANGSARLNVVSVAGKVVFDCPTNVGRTFGPFAAGSTVTVQSTKGSTDYTITTPTQATSLPGKPTVRGRRVILCGGSEIARGFVRKATTTTGVVFNAATQTISVETSNAHGLATGAEVFIANESAVAPFLNSSAITVDNGFAYGTITVTGTKTFTMPYWSALPAGSPYLSLNGTCTSAFTVHAIGLATPMSVFNELNHWLGGAFDLVLSIATGSSNSMNFTERIPALVKLAQAGSFDELAGTFGIGNTLLWANNHSWTVAQVVAQCVSDMTAFSTALAPYGIVCRLQLPPAQLNSTGATIDGTQAVNEALRQLALDSKLRFVIEDALNWSSDPTTGLARARYVLNGTDNVHPSHEGAKTTARRQADLDLVRGNHTPSVYRLAYNPLDNFKSDATGLQIFDPLLAATPTAAASGLDAKCTGNVPDLVTVITTAGNAGRSAVFSFEQTAELYHIYATLTAAAAGDTFLIGITNKAGTRKLDTVLATLPGHRFFCGCDFSFTPTTPANWTSIDTYFQATLTYGPASTPITAQVSILAADTYNGTLNPDGPLTEPRVGPALMRPFTLPTDLTAISGAGLYFNATAAAAGTAVLRITLPTLRDIT